MIKVNDSARDQVLKLIATEAHPANAFIRVGVKGGGCSGLMYELEFDTEVKEGDQVFEDNGTKYKKLFLSTIIFTSLSSKTLSSSNWLLSNFKSYDKPEQPPLFTPTLTKSFEASKPSSCIISMTFFLAMSETFIIIVK